MADQQKSYLSNDVIFSDLERPLHPVSRSHHSLTLKYIRNGTRYRHSFNEIGLLIGTCVLHNSEWFSKTFNDTKRRAVSLRELSILLSRGSTLTILIQQLCLSVCPSVRHVPIFYRNGLTYCHSFFATAQSFQFYEYRYLREIPTGSPPCLEYNLAIFDQQVAISRKRYKIAPWKVNRKPHPSF